jgi:hypothetical protein
VLTQAANTLELATARRVRAPFWRSWHAAFPIAGTAIAYLSWLPLPPLPASAAPPPGADRVQMAEIAGLEKIIKLEELDARDAKQKERLKQLAEDAKKLREKIKNGVEKREAQADLAKLRDGITAERLSLGDGEQRQGLESALGKLAENPDMKDAAKSLGDRDLVNFDDDMEELANKLESKDRERAKKTLEEAAEAAKRNGGPGVAKELAQQKELMDQRGKKADNLRELAKALGEGLGDEGKEALKNFDRSGSGKDEQKLAEKLEEALGKLSPEERKRLADNLKKRASKMQDEGGAEPPSKKDLKQLAKELETPEGKKKLEEELKKMAEDPGPESDEAERQHGLDGAQEGAGEAEGSLGGTPMPMPMAGGGAGKENQGGGKGGQDKGPPEGPPGHTEGGGKGDHKGQTGVVDGPGVKAKANATINKGKPMPGIVQGRTTGRAGETAKTRGEGALGSVGSQEIGSVEHSDVPEEYREQVGRYFQPK